MKNMIKRIIVGVAIGTILFIIKGGNVFAYTWSQSTMSMIEIYYKFDLCTDYDGQLICNAGFEGTSDLKQLLVDTPLYTTKSNEYLALKEFNVHIKFNNNNVLETTNGIVLQPPYTYFIGLNGWSGWNIDSFEHRYNLTTYNAFVDSFAYIRDGQTDYTIQDNNQYGLNIDSYYISSLNKYVYTTYPYTHLGATRRIKDFKYSFQSGYTYSGPNNIFNYVFYDSSSDMPSVANFLNTYKNNTYLGVVFPNTTLKIPAASNLSSGSWNFMNGNYSSSLFPYINYAYSEIQQEIDNNASYLNKEMIIASSWIGSDTPDNEQFEDISSSISVLSTGINSSLSTFGFQDFLAALIQKPITELTFMIRNDNVGGNDNLTIKCPTIYLPFKVDHTTGTNIYGMYLPCMSDLYSSIPYVGSSGDNLGTGSLIGIYQVVLTGFLTYLLVLSWLNIIKHTITNSPSEIEVYEL